MTIVIRQIYLAIAALAPSQSAHPHLGPIGLWGDLLRSVVMMVTTRERGFDAGIVLVTFSGDDDDECNGRVRFVRVFVCVVRTVMTAYRERDRVG